MKNYQKYCDVRLKPLLGPLWPIRSGTPDFGLDQEFLAKTGQELVWFLPKVWIFRKRCFYIGKKKPFSGQIFSHFTRIVLIDKESS